MTSGRPDPVASEEPEQAVLLSAFRDEDWRTLLSFTVRRTFRAGETVIRRGESDRALYIVADGRLALDPPDRNAPTQPDVVVEAGSVLGEVSFFDGLPRSADVRALTDGELVQLSYDSFERFADQEPRLARLLLLDLGRILALRLRST